jgi:hypothetical protein
LSNGEELDARDRRFVKTVPTYLSFIADKLNKIYDAWAANNLVGALHLAYQLAMFLPPDSKKKLREDMDRIRSGLNKCYSSQGTDEFTTHLVRNRMAGNFAVKELEVFVDKLVAELDRKNYLEQGRTRVESDDFDKMKKKLSGET